ncbi:MAG TPA: FliM/FliN family flagellar motor switch protein [Acidobacteriaceae bacterium]|jgi:flagellar motor switch protein FliN/FliY|nr:FliM/FliN family flagellar motor switch protein [Acidobacteriaceae bacterium]
MPDQSARPWIGKLEAEIARELGQTVTIAAGGPEPESGRSLGDVLEVPGARLDLAVDAEDAAGLLVEGKVIEAGQADSETVRELWSGILTSVAARLGGRRVEGAPESASPGASCTLRLGAATMRMALRVEGFGSDAGVEKSNAVVDSEGRETAPRREAGQPGPANPQPPAGNYDLLLEVELEASVRFGSREMELKELLELGPGDVVELDRHVSDPVDLIVGDKIVAHGEVVLVNGNFGLRVTEVAEPVRRLESIRCLM